LIRVQDTGEVKLQTEKGHNRRGLLLKIVLGVALFGLLWFLTSLAYVSIGAETDHAARSDVIVVLGCRVSGDGGASRCIRARAHHAADLYRRDLADWVIAAGGETERGPTESSVLRRVLEGAGVPPSAILEESRSHNTIQNLRYSSEIMRERGWSSALLVTEPYHINRAALIARDFGLEVYPSPALGSANWSNFGPRAYNLARDTLSLMLYQVKSLVGIRD
jgi:uncharacterized SAM-binding protein YcdF (DUF218 family)